MAGRYRKKRHMTEKLGVNEKEPAFGQKTQYFQMPGHTDRQTDRCTDKLENPTHAARLL